MRRRKLSVLLCEDMKDYADRFYEKQHSYFHVTRCDDVHSLIDDLRECERNDSLPDVLLLDLFSRRDDVEEDERFREKRQKIDADVKLICEKLRSTGKDAREILSAHGIDILKDIRKEFPEHKLPILLYSRLGPYILQPEEAADVDEYNAEFLLKWLDHDEQRKKIRRFFDKWRSQDRPIPLEISRKLSTLPAALATAVDTLLKTRKFEAAAKEGLLELDQFLKAKLKCARDGGELANHMRTVLKQGRRRNGEKPHEFEGRVDALADMYKGIYKVKRNFFAHNKSDDAWREVDICLSVYNLIWREVEEIMNTST